MCCLQNKPVTHPLNLNHSESESPPKPESPLKLNAKLQKILYCSWSIYDGFVNMQQQILHMYVTA